VTSPDVRSTALEAERTASPDETAGRYVIRVWLPDRPGALGAVASRIGSVAGDLTGIEIIDRGGGSAIDELTVELASDHLDLALREIRAVDGVRVESVRTLDQPPDDPRLGPLAAARDLARASRVDALADLLAHHACLTLTADWSAVVSTETGRTIASRGEGPPAEWLAAYARGAPGEAQAHDPLSNEGDLVCATLDDVRHALVVGRTSVPLRTREGEVIAALAALAAIRWQQLV
jgi:hypothetical protein